MSLNQTARLLESTRPDPFGYTKLYWRDPETRIRAAVDRANDYAIANGHMDAGMRAQNEKQARRWAEEEGNV